MGRKSREHREKRERQSDKANRLEEELRQLADGDATFCKPKQCLEGFWESHLEDVLAFESVGSGTSIFDGLQQHGLDLPHPDKLNERESAKKVVEVLKALEELQVILVGCSNMSARQFYRTLWNQDALGGMLCKKETSGCAHTNRCLPCHATIRDACASGGGCEGWHCSVMYQSNMPNYG